VVMTEISEAEKEKARRIAQNAKKNGEITTKDRCDLCGMQRTDLVMHHWNGHDHPKDIWFVCQQANSNLDHNGVSIDQIRLIWEIETNGQLNFLEQGKCGWMRFYKNQQIKWVKSFRTWYSNPMHRYYQWGPFKGRRKSWKTIRNDFFEDFRDSRNFIKILTRDELLKSYDITK
jgi:hypothetical protein